MISSSDYIYIEKVFDYLKTYHVGNIPEIIFNVHLPSDDKANELYRIQSKLIELDIIKHQSNGLSGFHDYNLSNFGIRFSNGSELVRYIKDLEKEDSRKKKRETVNFRLSIWSFIVSIIAIIVSMIAILYSSK